MVSAAACMADAKPLCNCEVGRALRAHHVFVFVFFSAILKGRSSDQFSSVSQSCLTLCDPMNCSTPGLPVHHQLLEFTQTHIHRVGDPAISSFVVPFSSCPQSLPTSGSFPMSRLFAWDGWTGLSALASFFPKNTQGWSLLEWTGWISLQFREFSRVFSNTAVQTHQFFGAQLSSRLNSHIHTWP